MSTVGPVVPALEIKDASGGYGSLQVLRAVSLRVDPGEAVALLGPNGAGKTTLLRAAAGLLRLRSGEVLLAGEDAAAASPSERSQKGLCLIPEGRGIFRNLTVRENLRISAPRWVKEPRFDLVFEAFPILNERQKQIAGTMSGGQQQMLALSRAIVAQPSVVLVDEVSMGLAPIMVDVIFDALQALVKRGVALLLVEQYVERALAISNRVYLLKKGEITDSGSAKELESSGIMDEYMGHVPDPQDVETSDHQPSPATASKAPTHAAQSRG
jgi:branched-chain amino acid transport system ATP-binding protein